MLVKVYKKLLKLGPFHTNKKGKVFICMKGDKSPFKVNDKVVYLPTKHALSMKDKRHVEIFHPLRENIMTGPPATLIAFRNVGVWAYNNIYIQYFIQLLHEASKADTISDFTIKTLLSEFPSITKTDLKHILEMCSEFDCLKIDLQHHKSGKVVAVVTSPLLNELHDTLAENNERVIGNHKVTLKSMKSMKAILNSLFKFKDSKEAAVTEYHATGDIAKSTEVITSALGSELMALSLGKLSEYFDIELDKLPDFSFFELNIFSDKKHLSSLIKEVTSNGSLAKKIKKKSKKKKKKKKLNQVQNPYGVVNPGMVDAYGCQQTHIPLDADPDVDSELMAIQRLGIPVSQPAQTTTYLPPTQPVQPASPYLQTNTPVNVYGIPTAGTDLYQEPKQPVWGKFGWT